MKRGRPRRSLETCRKDPRDVCGWELSGPVKVVKGTYWAAYQAVTEYLSHEYGRTAESRYNALWFHHSQKMNRLALEIAVTRAKAG